MTELGAPAPAGSRWGATNVVGLRPDPEVCRGACLEGRQHSVAGGHGTERAPRAQTRAGRAVPAGGLLEFAGSEDETADLSKLDSPLRSAETNTRDASK